MRQFGVDLPAFRQHRDRLPADNGGFPPAGLGAPPGPLGPGPEGSMHGILIARGPMRQGRVPLGDWPAA